MRSSPNKLRKKAINTSGISGESSFLNDKEILKNNDPKIAARALFILFEFSLFFIFILLILTVKTFLIQANIASFILSIL